MMMDLHELLADARPDRLRAIRELPASEALGFALRRVLYTDRDANVRAAAARRIAAIDPSDAPEPWLLDALADRSPLVRDAILRALARCGTTKSVPALRALVEHDQMWWIRRSAIYSLAAISGTAELAAFTGALADPFWRVRHAAVRVLTVLGARDPEVRDVVLETPPSSTLTFLRSSWGPAPIEAPVRAATLRSELPPALLDPDPAVVTARLATDRDVTPRALVELLCDPHTALRELASERLVATGDSAAFEAALDWLEEPRIPHVVDTVHYLLDHLGDPAGELATRALVRHDRVGAGRWAIGWVVATRSESLYDAARERARRGDDTLRRVALPIVGTDELVTWAAAGSIPSGVLVDAIAAELHGRRAYDALARLDGTGHPRVRALQIDARARRESSDVVSRWSEVDAALADPHHGPRAIAVHWLVRAGRIDAASVANDRDPTVREAALSGSIAAPAAAAAIHDADPWVRRAAMRTLASAYRDREDVPAPVVEATCIALTAIDPWLRQQACGIALQDDRALGLTLSCLGDRDEMVRAAALDALEHLPDSDARVRALVATGLPSPARAMAYSWLVRRLDDAATELARTAHAGETDPRVLAVLAGAAGIEPPVIARAPHDRIERAPTPAPSTERRSFGRAGFTVAPLAISGAYDPSTRALEAAAAAGVDLYFWEPGYDLLTRFVRSRRDRVRVVTGSYHADAASIRLDVDRALRTLRRDVLDAFLLFWTRSRARVDPEAYAVLDELRREGKIRAIGFSTHHRELARTAIETSPWDVVMIRHSAAHPGIETELLPAARAANTAILTFSALCYGRMLSGPNAPSPSECYRYSLSQPGVTACISAPRRYRELAENLDALATPLLPADRIAALREHGAGVRAESQRFNTLLRQPTRDAAAAAREMLAAELPPSDSESAPRRLPTASQARRSRTRLGGPRRR